MLIFKTKFKILQSTYLMVIQIKTTIIHGSNNPNHAFDFYNLLNLMKIESLTRLWLKVEYPSNNNKMTQGTKIRCSTSNLVTVIAKPIVFNSSFCLLLLFLTYFNGEKLLKWKRWWEMGRRWSRGMFWPLVVKSSLLCKIN